MLPATRFWQSTIEALHLVGPHRYKCMRIFEGIFFEGGLVDCTTEHCIWRNGVMAEQWI